MVIVDNVKFYGVYHARNETATKGLATTAQPTNLFPPSIQYEGVNYALSKSFQVSTPSQQKQFEAYCLRNHLETNVEFYS